MAIKKDLMVCASCEYIFSQKEFDDVQCPVCSFGSYYAVDVYGKAAYRYKKSQKPFRDKKVAQAVCSANIEVNADIERAESFRRDLVMEKLGIDIGKKTKQSASTSMGQTASSIMGMPSPGHYTMSSNMPNLPQSLRVPQTPPNMESELHKWMKEAMEAEMRAKMMGNYPLPQSLGVPKEPPSGKGSQTNTVETDDDTNLP